MILFFRKRQLDVVRQLDQILSIDKNFDDRLDPAPDVTCAEFECIHFVAG